MSSMFLHLYVFYVLYSSIETYFNVFLFPNLCFAQLRLKGYSQSEALWQLVSCRQMCASCCEMSRHCAVQQAPSLGLHVITTLHRRRHHRIITIAKGTHIPWDNTPAIWKRWHSTCHSDITPPPSPSQCHRQRYTLYSHTQPHYLVTLRWS